LLLDLDQAVRSRSNALPSRRRDAYRLPDWEYSVVQARLRASALQADPDERRCRDEGIGTLRCGLDAARCGTDRTTGQ